MEAPLPPCPSPREPPPPASLPPKMISARRDRQGIERSGEESDGDAEEKINAHPSAHGNYDKGYCALIASIDKGAKAAAGAALRRLHFRAGRQRASLPGPRSPVPKVIVMGSSTTSERTINTSTESANTILTNVTATDGDTTEDSLDRDGPAQEVLVSLDSAEGEPQRRRRRRRSPGERAAARIPEGASEADRTPEAVPIERRKSELPPRRDAASPGFRRASETRFPFDAGSFGDSRSVDDAPSVFDSDGGSPVRATRFAFDAPIATSPTEGRSRELLLVDFDSRERPPKSPKASNSKGEARFTFEGVGGDRRSAESRARKSSATPPPPPPDLRIDPPEGGAPAGGELDASEPAETGSPSARPAGTKGRLGSVDVNVTTNPLDNGSGCCNLTCPAYSDGQYACCACCSNDLSRNSNRKIPQATIVVQQASLSLDYSCVSTVLLGDEPSPSPSGRRPSAKRKKQRDDRMKRLLDATDRLTREEIRDFEMRYGSPHHSRSQSVKTGTRGLLGPPPQRARVASMPSTGVEEQYYRLRHFSITGKGVVNRGDSLKSRRSRSNTSVASSNSSTEHLTPRASAPPSLGSSRESSASAPPPAPYRVLVLGAPGVGKSSLISQFMTSEYLHAYDTSIDDDSGEKSVSVLLAGEESELVFIDQTCNVGPEADIDGPEPHAYCVVYSTADRGSLRTAEGWLRTLRSKRPNRARILVGNKADLVRSRAVSPDEGKSLAINYDCKFIETSVGINHNVDELLVGLLTQIRLKQEHPERTRRRGGSSAQNSPRKQRGARLSASLKVRGLLGRVWARDSKSKSCENLHVL